MEKNFWKKKWKKYMEINWQKHKRREFSDSNFPAGEDYQKRSWQWKVPQKTMEKSKGLFRQCGIQTVIWWNFWVIALHTKTNWMRWWLPQKSRCVSGKLKIWMKCICQHRWNVWYGRPSGLWMKFSRSWAARRNVYLWKWHVPMARKENVPYPDRRNF